MTDRFLSFLENIYGVLFTPAMTFCQLRDNPFPAGGAIVVILVNSLEALRQDAGQLTSQVGFGLIGWLCLALVLQRLCRIFQKETSLDVILTLSGFASLPWLFIAPALDFGGSPSTILALGVIGWFCCWQVWATSIALNISPGQAISLLPLAFLGGITSIALLSSGIKILSLI